MKKRLVPFAGKEEREEPLKVSPLFVLCMFRRGMDTMDIAKRFRLTEAEAYSMLASAREIERSLPVAKASIHYHAVGA